MMSFRWVTVKFGATVSGAEAIIVDGVKTRLCNPKGAAECVARDVESI